MGAVSTAATLAVGLLWQTTGAEVFADRLLRAATTGGEDEATVAVIALTRGGDRAVPPVRDAIARGSVELVDVLVGIGSDSAHNALEELQGSTDSDIASEASRGLRLLEREGPGDA